MIKTLKLVSGEELVVEVMEETNETVTFKNPVACILQRGPDGSPIVGFMPWMHSSSGPFTVKTNNLLLIVDVAEEVKNGYNQIFGAGIVVPPKQLIVG